MKNSYKLSLVAIAASVLMVGCSSVEELVEEYANDEGSDYVNTPTTGQFVDTYVKGLKYTCTGMENGEIQLTGSGVTNDKGEFTCPDKGELVEFSLGGYVIGSYQNSGFAEDAAPIVTPYDLYHGSNEASLNLAQLLQTLDDHTLDGVLTIPANFTALDNVDIKLDDPDFDALMADALPNVTALVSEEVAQAHLDETLVSLGLMETTEPAPEPAEPAALESFVSGKNITFSGSEGSMTATFAGDGYYEENSDTHFCMGSWTMQSTSAIQITCAAEGVAPTAEDTSNLEFVGELKTGMTVMFGSDEVTITNIETAVNPDA